MRPFFLALCAALAFALAGCKGQCRSLSEKLCECAANSVEKDSCLRNASQAESGNPPSSEDELRCGELLPNCDCRLANTPEGKQACGLAR